MTMVKCRVTARGVAMGISKRHEIRRADGTVENEFRPYAASQVDEFTEGTAEWLIKEGALTPILGSASDTEENLDARVKKFKASKKSTEEAPE